MKHGWKVCCTPYGLETGYMLKERESHAGLGRQSRSRPTDFSCCMNHNPQFVKCTFIICASLFTFCIFYVFALIFHFFSLFFYLLCFFVLIDFVPQFVYFKASCDCLYCSSGGSACHILIRRLVVRSVASPVSKSIRLNPTLLPVAVSLVCE